MSLLRALRRTARGRAFSISIALFVAAASLNYALFPEFLLSHFDGMYFYSEMMTLSSWGGPFLGPTYTPMEGMYSLTHPGNAALIPHLAPYFLLHDPDTAIFLSYVIFATILYASSLFLLVNIGANKYVAIVASFLTFFMTANLQATHSVGGLQTTVVYNANLLLGLLLCIGRSPRLLFNSLYAAAFIVLALLILAADPAVATLAGPTLLVFGIAALVASRSRSELLWKIAAAAAAACATAGLYAEYVMTLFAFSARVLLSGSFETSPFGWRQPGVPFYPEHQLQFYLLMAFSGALSAVLLGKKTGITRPVITFALAALATIFLWCAAGLVFMLGWFGSDMPNWAYFDQAAFPILCLFIVQGLRCVGSYLAVESERTARLGRVFAILAFPLATYFLWRARLGLPWMTICALYAAANLWYSLATFFQARRAARPAMRLVAWAPLLIAFAAVGLQNQDLGINEARWTERLNLRPNDIEAFLAERTRLTPNGKFRGAVETSYKVTPKPASNTYYLLNSSFQNIAEFHNPLQVFSWHRLGIPTLSQYGHYVTPDLFYLVSHTLDTGDIMQSRNILVVTEPNSKILAMLGVRYLVTSTAGSANSAGAELVHKSGSLSVFELKRPNLFDYSPTMPVQFANFQDFIGLISSSAFDPEKEFAVYDASLAGYALVPARNASGEFLKRGLRVKAQAPGWAVIVMPLDYSRCLRASGDSGDVRLFRSNVAMTGILFKEVLDARVEMAYGPLQGIRCRRLDLDDIRDLLAPAPP